MAHGARGSRTHTRRLKQQGSGCSALDNVAALLSTLSQNGARHSTLNTMDRGHSNRLDTALVALGLDESQCPMERLENDNCNGTARNYQ